MAEMRLIDANALPRKEVQIKTRSMLDGRRNIYPKVDIVTAYSIDRAPTIDAVPVVHAEWEVTHVWKNNPQTTLRCSACKCLQPIYEHETWLYCPFCGAKMDGGEA